MLRSLGTSVAAGDCVALEAYAVRAGAAMACAFSSSDEFEAALIAERRAAGAYGSSRQYQMLVTGAAVAAALATILYFIV